MGGGEEDNYINWNNVLYFKHQKLVALHGKYLMHQKGRGEAEAMVEQCTRQSAGSVLY